MIDVESKIDFSRKACLQLPIQFSKTTEANVNEIGENHFLILKNLFPDSDSEFLHQKAIEFSEDKEKMNQWIEQQLIKTESKNSLKILESIFFANCGQ